MPCRRILINARNAMHHIPPRRMQQKIAVIIDANLVSALEVQPDITGIGTRLHHEIIFQQSRLAVIHQVDARIDVLVMHLAIGGDIATPSRGIVADEIVALAKFIKQALRGEACEIYGDGNQTRDFIFIADLVEAIVKVLF